MSVSMSTLHRPVSVTGKASGGLSTIIRTHGVLGSNLEVRHRSL